MTTVLPAAPVLTPVRTVLICDERPTSRMLLARRLTTGTSVIVTGAVPDAFTLVDAYTARPADVVFIGVHRDTAAGAQALDLLLGLHPAATVIVFGSTDDAAQLTAALPRGARGLGSHPPGQTRTGTNRETPGPARRQLGTQNLLNGNS